MGALLIITHNTMSFTISRIVIWIITTHYINWQNRRKKIKEKYKVIYYPKYYKVISIWTWNWWSSCPFGSSDWSLHKSKQKQVMPSGIATWQVRKKWKWWIIPSSAELIHSHSQVQSIRIHTHSLLTRLCAWSTAHTHS